MSDEPRLDGPSRFLPVADNSFYLEQDPEVTMTFSDLAAGGYQTMSFESYGWPWSNTRVTEGQSADA